MIPDFKYKSFLLALSAIFFFTFGVSCADDDKENPAPGPYVCSSCSDSPDALAANDASAKGIYKGIIIGSSGTLFVDIQNGSNVISATMVLDGDTIPLTSSVEYINGEPYLAPFVGTYNGSPVSITFAVDADGTSPTVITSDIPGHPNADFVVVKETSTSLIEAFEGTYTKTGESGIFNILLSRGTINAWGGISRDNTTTVSEDISGTITANQLYMDGENVAEINGDILQGTFIDDQQMTVTVNGQRTL
ncbi:MAG TPA: hypothetical protein VGB43_05670 [Flavobacterium sp.]